MMNNRKEYLKQYWEENKERLVLRRQERKEEISEYMKRWNRLHKDEKVTYNREYRLKNLNKLRANELEYSRTHKDQRKLSQKMYYQKNKDKINEQKREWVRKNIDINPNLKLSLRLRSRLNMAVKNNCKGGSAVRDMGCSIEYLRNHLKAQFQSGMSWDNWTRNGWHIDHIQPLSSFDLTDREQFLQAVHYTNLQPLWATDNILKSNKPMYSKG